MSSFLDIHLKLYYNLTRCAKLSTMLISAEKVLPIFDEETHRERVEVYNWFRDAISSLWQWIDTRKMTAKEFYNQFIKDKIGHYLLEDTPRDAGAFNTCINTILYGAEIMYNFSNPDDVKNFPIPSIIADTDYIITVKCLEWALKASEDKEEELAWQEKVINQLLQDYYTEEFDTLGELIGREYFEQFS